MQSTGRRTDPDVAFVADPSTGVWIADTYNLQASSPWEVAGGTSVGAPSWAGLVALVNQGRTEAGESTLGSSSPNQTQQALYSLPASDFHQVVGGSNGGFTATAGYNLVTGLGSPVANVLVPSLVSYGSGAGFTPVVRAPLDFASFGAGKQTPATGIHVFDALTSSDSVAVANGSALLAGASASGLDDALISTTPACNGLAITSYMSDREMSPGTSIMQGVTATGSGVASGGNGLAASERVWLDWSAHSNGQPSSLDEDESANWLQVLDPDLASPGPIQMPSLIESAGRGSEIGEVIASEPKLSAAVLADQISSGVIKQAAATGSRALFVLQAVIGLALRSRSRKELGKSQPRVRRTDRCHPSDHGS